MNLTTLTSTGGFVPINLDTYEVWHHIQTIGVLVLRGRKRTLIKCRLILLEREDMAKKPEILSDLSSQNYAIHEVDFDTMLTIIKACQDLSVQKMPITNTATHQKDLANSTKIQEPDMWSLLKGILPGTKWCGVNDVAKNYEDLGSGSYFEVDKCCRTHDHCPLKVYAFSTRYHAINYHPYTKSHCACDDLLYNCLKRLASEKQQFGPDTASIASSIGNVYFNVIGIECAEPKYQKTCLNYTTVRNRQAKLFFNQSKKKSKSEDIIKCQKWKLDKSVTPAFSFRKPNRVF